MPQTRSGWPGRCVAVRSTACNLVEGDTDRAYAVFVHDRESGRPERVSVGPNGRQAYARGVVWAIDARVVGFTSWART